MIGLTTDLLLWKEQLKEIIYDFSSQVTFKQGQILVIGCSTSEVIGEKIGTAGSEEVASVIFDELTAFARNHGIHLAFQCCEHLNRSLVIERELMNRHEWEEVSVIPVRAAGGAVATYAYHHFQDPVVIEFIKADAGIDIGNTFIGMHLKHVAVPIRVKNHTLGSANVTIAKTRPKLIGGARAVYENQMNENQESC
ncbi:TIGR01440 family protein [Heyndrickxia sporothermodurans]|uniref:TIGR01440 family protein n=1 Tax=Heyndrickxia sporothermodurans TaxID=46224 RepID=UPI002E281926|nr:TIGR01440 family protein [Heyndrickxia sporothermodurans]